MSQPSQCAASFKKNSIALIRLLFAQSFFFQALTASSEDAQKHEAVHQSQVMPTPLPREDEPIMVMAGETAGPTVNASPVPLPAEREDPASLSPVVHVVETAQEPATAPAAAPAPSTSSRRSLLSRLKARVRKALNFTHLTGAGDSNHRGKSKKKDANAKRGDRITLARRRGSSSSSSSSSRSSFHSPAVTNPVAPSVASSASIPPQPGRVRNTTTAAAPRPVSGVLFPSNFFGTMPDSKDPSDRGSEASGSWDAAEEARMVRQEAVEEAGIRLGAPVSALILGAEDGMGAGMGTETPPSEPVVGRPRGKALQNVNLNAVPAEPAAAAAAPGSGSREAGSGHGPPVPARIYLATC